MSKLLELWVAFGTNVSNGYVMFVEKTGRLALLVAPIMLVGFTIPWFVVTAVLLALDLVYGRIVYGVTIKDQCSWVKEGIDEAWNDHRNDTNC